jgi:tripartite-type tricarboxylate transporter receptor subunit TctC
MTRFWAASVFAASAALASASPVLAQSVADFYRGKQVEVIAGSASGTSYDSWARVIAQFMPRHLPGRPSFIVKDMPGAGHIKATNYLYSVAPKDGTSIGVISQLMPTASVLKNKPGLEADFTKFYFLGSPDRTNQVCIARKDAPVKSAADLFTKELTVGGAGAGSGVSAIPIFLHDALGMKFKLVEGYKSSIEVMLAIERGEVEGMCQTYQGVLHSRPNAFTTGGLRLLFNIEEKPIPGAGAPSVHQFIKDGQARKMIVFYSLNAEIGRPIIAPPGTPRARVEALRKAFDAMSKDPEFLAEATKQHLDPAPFSAAEQEEIFRRILATPKEIIARAAKFM